MSNVMPAPEVLSGYQGWRLLDKALREYTDLSPLEGEPFSKDRPASGLHKVYQVTPGPSQYLGRMRADEDADDYDLIIKKRSVTVTLYHDYDPHSHDPSFIEADADLEAVENALCTHPDALALKCELTSSTSTRKGHTITQTIALTITYERLLPQIPE